MSVPSSRHPLVLAVPSPTTREAREVLIGDCRRALAARILPTQDQAFALLAAYDDARCLLTEAIQMLAEKASLVASLKQANAEQAEVIELLLQRTEESDISER